MSAHGFHCLLRPFTFLTKLDSPATTTSRITRFRATDSTTSATAHATATAAVPSANGHDEDMVAVGNMSKGTSYKL